MRSGQFVFDYSKKSTQRDKAQSTIYQVGQLCVVKSCRQAECFGFGAYSSLLTGGPSPSWRKTNNEVIDHILSPA